MREWLKGKKTYLVGAAGILTAVAAFASGEIEIAGLVSAIWAAAMAMAVRAGIKKGPLG